VLASDHSLAGQLRRSTALGPVEILLGIITFATALGEGAANERLTLMLVDNRGVPPVGVLTFAGLSLNVTMAIGRFLAGLSSSATAERQCCAQPAFWHVQGWGALCLVNGATQGQLR
jgi:hypothetical protein